MNKIKQSPAINKLTDKKQLELKILHDHPQLVPETHYSNRLQIVVSRLLDKNPQNRPTADELLRLIPEFNENAWQEDGGMFEGNSFYSSGVVKLRENFRSSVEPILEQQKNEKKKEKEAPAMSRLVGQRNSHNLVIR